MHVVLIVLQHEEEHEDV